MISVMKMPVIPLQAAFTEPSMLLHEIGGVSALTVMVPQGRSSGNSVGNDGILFSRKLQNAAVSNR